MNLHVMLIMMSANCIALGTGTFVEVVISAKKFFHSGCLYLLQSQEAGKENRVICFDCLMQLRLLHAVTLFETRPQEARTCIK
jgi:hypothetical protein